MVHLYKYKTENMLDSGAEKQTPRRFYDADGRETSRGMHYLKDALSREFPDESVAVFKDENGRPHVDRPGTFVSVTHAKNVVICGISDTEIGIDFEEKRKKLDPMKIAKRHFTEEEKNMLQQSGQESFYEIWCRKEAFSKHEGSGLSYGIKNIGTVRKTAPENESKRVEYADRIEGVPIFGKWMDDGYFACAGVLGDVTWIEIQE